MDDSISRDFYLFSRKSLILRENVSNATILRRPRRPNKDAIVIMAQKRHSTYGRDSLSLLYKSLSLLYQNYLVEHKDSVDVFIFHTGDFVEADLDILDDILHETGIVRLVNILDSPYWGRPAWLEGENSSSWANPSFSEGYRHMIRFFTIHIWNFFSTLSMQQRLANGSTYDYILRLDEDSFLHSPIHYNIFDFMRENQYLYGFRMCSYEMYGMKWVWNYLNRNKYEPYRDIDPKMCGIYNNFFVASIGFFLSVPVQHFLKEIDASNMIHQKCLGDLQIHSIIVYSFCPPHQIHRFLDFTYEHATFSKVCNWGGIQAGFNDSFAKERLNQFNYSMHNNTYCGFRRYTMNESDLSPTYNHHSGKGLLLETIIAGAVETVGMGLLSG
jgi:alpha 1,2-mannosyltransferase